MQPYPFFLRLIFGAIATLGSCAGPLLAAAEESVTYQLTIAAQPLEDALQEFARQTGIQIVFVSQITNRLRANPVGGHYSLTSGLDALLAGSGLTYRVLNPLTVAIRRENPQSTKPSESAHAEMEQVVVRGTAEQLVATRTQTPLREIPQTVSIISHEQIEQQNDTDIADALGRAPGVSIERINSLDRDLYVRGFRVTPLHIDGGTADWAFYREQTHQVWMQLRQHFGSGWTARLNLLADQGSIDLQSSNWSSDGGAYRIAQGGYAVFDLRVGYQIDSHWRVALNMNNVFDRIYYESIGEPAGNNWYGEPRNGLLRIDGSF